MEGRKERRAGREGVEQRGGNGEREEGREWNRGEGMGGRKGGRAGRKGVEQRGGNGGREGKEG